MMVLENKHSLQTDLFRWNKTDEKNSLSLFIPSIAGLVLV